VSNIILNIEHILQIGRHDRLIGGEEGGSIDYLIYFDVYFGILMILIYH
jgi:hypothetical protein